MLVACIIVGGGKSSFKVAKSILLLQRLMLFYLCPVKYIKSQDGLRGCYRGLTPKLAANIVSGVAFQKVTEAIKFEVSQCWYGG